MARLPIRLTEFGVSSTPGRTASLLGKQGWDVAYGDVQRVVLVEPQGRRRGRLILTQTPDDEEALEVGFPSGDLRAMRTLYSELWVRVQRARGQG